MSIASPSDPQVLRNPHPRIIGLLGPEYTQSHVVFLSKFKGREAEYLPKLVPSFPQLLARVRGDQLPQVQSGLWPFYNSSQRFITSLCQMLTEGSVYVVDAFPAEIHHCLMVREENRYRFLFSYGRQEALLNGPC